MIVCGCCGGDDIQSTRRHLIDEQEREIFRNDADAEEICIVREGASDRGRRFTCRLVVLVVMYFCLASHLIPQPLTLIKDLRDGIRAA